MARKFYLPNWSAPLALLVACVLAFGLSIPWLGLYGDDWPFVYVNHLAGLHGVVDFMTWSRPVAAWVFAASAALGGTHFWLYHLALLLLRWLDSLLLWRLLHRVWPDRPLPAFSAALLFAVYPAFKQQLLALEYIPHFVALALLFSSFELNLRLAEPTPNRPGLLNLLPGGLLALLAWSGAFQVFIIEYFVGLELLRPVLIFRMLTRCMDPRTAAKRAFRLWLPYLPVLAGFVVWRVFVVGFPSYQPKLVSGLVDAPLSTLLLLAQTIWHDLWMAGLAAWVQPLITWPVGGRTLLAYAALTFAALVLLGGYLLLYSRSQPAETLLTPLQTNPFAWALEYIGLGLLAMLAAGWPFWITNIPLSLDFPWDRTSLAFMTGACLLIVGLLGLLRWRLIQIGLIALLAASSIGLHFQNTIQYRKEWNTLTAFYWQLTWRAPALAPGTAIILDQSPFNYHVDKFLSPVMNWTYAPESRALETPYALLDFHKLWGKTLPPTGLTDPLATRYATLSFHGDTSRVLVVVYAPPGCLRILTPAEESHLLLSTELKQSLVLTNLALIDPAISQAAVPPVFLGSELPHDWCYSYEKASLAAQFEDWPEAARLGDQAFTDGFSPRQPSEHLLFAEAYARSGRWTDARAMASRTAESGDFYRNASCVMWERLGAQQLDPEEIYTSLVETGCR